MADCSEYRLAVVASHPIQYQAPLFRALADHPQINPSVYFCWDFGVTEQVDPDFRVKVKWDIPMLNGYPHKFLANFSPSPGSSLMGQINPGIFKELQQGRYDAVLIQGYNTVTSLLSIIAGQITGTPVIFRGEANLFKRRTLGKTIGKAALLFHLLRMVGAVLYSCSSNRQYFEHYGVPSHKLFFAPCAVDNDYFRNAASQLRHRKEKLKEQLGIPSHSRVLLVVGKLISRKRPMDVLKAYERLRDREDAWLVFVGDGREKQAMLDYVQQRGLTQVYMPGFKNQSELPSFYSMADVFLIPSADDLSPKALNEAMNFALPVISSDRVGTALDLVKHGENGFIHKAGDVEALSGYMSEFLDNPEMTQRLGRRSVEIVSEWSLDRDAQGMLEALEYATLHRRHGTW